MREGQAVHPAASRLASSLKAIRASSRLIIVGLQQYGRCQLQGGAKNGPRALDLLGSLIVVINGSNRSTAGWLAQVDFCRHM
jgi:hypothetical protein